MSGVTDEYAVTCHHRWYGSQIQLGIVRRVGACGMHQNKNGDALQQRLLFAQ